MSVDPRHIYSSSEERAAAQTQAVAARIGSQVRDRVYQPQRAFAADYEETDISSFTTPPGDIAGPSFDLEIIEEATLVALYGEMETKFTAVNPLGVLSWFVDTDTGLTAPMLSIGEVTRPTYEKVAPQAAVTNPGSSADWYINPPGGNQRMFALDPGTHTFTCRFRIDDVGYLTDVYITNIKLWAWVI